MGSHEMHFPWSHHLPLGGLTTAPVLGVWESLEQDAHPRVHSPLPGSVGGLPSVLLHPQVPAPMGP